jgi:ribosome-associated translation inhibitor RaiA
MSRQEIESKIKYWEKMRDYYTANDRQKKRIQKDINRYKEYLRLRYNSLYPVG